MIHFSVSGQKEGGQELVGGLDCTVHRNFFGSQASNFIIFLIKALYFHNFNVIFKNTKQIMKVCCYFLHNNIQIQSFEAEVPVPDLAAKEGGPPSFRAVFIRAPAILEVGPDVEVLASISIRSTDIVDPSQEAQPDTKVIVAVKQGNLLATAFHPELTIDSRWYFHFLNYFFKQKIILLATLS